MGMAASQARLLMLTARLHDLEYEAQSIQNAKIQLSTQQDAVYEDYQKALDATTLTFTSIDPTSSAKSTMVANYNNLFSINRATEANGNHYLLIDSRGRVVVDDEIYEGYQNYIANHGNGNSGFMNNAYEFAWYMVEGEMSGHDLWSANGQLSPLQEAVQTVFEEHFDEMETMYNNACEALYEAYGTQDSNDTEHTYSSNGWWSQTWGEPSLTQILTYAQYPKPNNMLPGVNNYDELNEVLDEFINYFWAHYGQQVYNAMDENAANFNNDIYNSAEFNYYVEIYNAIQQHGGCISISEYDGPNGSAANNSDWLTNMIQAGQMSIELINIDKNGKATFDGVSVASDSDLTYTTTTQIDKVALAKAEAKYEHDMKLIDKKDQKFDLALSKLETERNALTKQYDSIKKVAEDNIDRTFGIFS